MCDEQVPSVPNTTPRCFCGMVSKWMYDDIDRQWIETMCWRCLEYQWMKDPDNVMKKMCLPMDTDQMDRFIDVMTSEAGLRKTINVIPYSGKLKFGSGR